MKQNAMRTFGALLVGILAVPFFAFPVQAHAQTYYYYQTPEIMLKIQAILAQLVELQRQLNALNGGSSTGGLSSGTRTDVRSVDVEFINNYAEVEIRYDSGKRDDLLLSADTESEVIDLLVNETKNSRNHLLAVTDFRDGDDDYGDSNDIRSIEVEIRNGDAHVEVRYDDGDRDTFTIENETQRRDIIEEIADELGIDEDDVEDLIDFENDYGNDEVDEIDVTIYRDDNEARAKVYFEDGDTTTYTISTDDEDDIIEELADLLDISESEVEDLIDFEYADEDEIDRIEVTIFDRDDEAEARVRYDDGSSTRYNFDTDDEDDIIEELADLLDMDEDDIEDLVEFDYDD